MKKQKIVIAASIAVFIFMCAIALLFPEEKYKYTLDEEKYGNPYGRDYICHVGDGKYVMMYTSGVDSLIVNTSRGLGSFVLHGEYQHKFDDDDLFFYGADGYAVVYAKSNLCKVYITDPPLELVTGDDPIISGRLPENNYRIGELVGEKFECIIYIDSFDEFTEYEQKMLKELIEKKERKDKITEFLY